MSGYNPIDIGFEPLQTTAAEGAQKLLRYLQSNHGLDISAIHHVTQIVLDDKWQWADSNRLRLSSFVDGGLGVAGPSFSISVNIAIGQAYYPVRLQVVPAMAASIEAPLAVCVNLKLGSAPYDSVFGFRPRDEGYFDDGAKGGLLKLCLGSALCLGSRTLMLSFDEIDFVTWPVPEVLKRLLMPEMTLRGRRPGLVTGIQCKLADWPSLERIWGAERLSEGGDDFLLLDDLLPDYDDDDDEREWHGA